MMAPPTALGHEGAPVAEAVVDPAQVHGDRDVPVGATDAGVVVEHVEAAEFADRLLAGGLHRVLFGDIDLQCGARAAALGDGGGGVLRGGLVEVDAHDTRALGGESQRRGSSYSRARPGDERDLPLEPVHERPPGRGGGTRAIVGAPRSAASGLG